MNATGLIPICGTGSMRIGHPHPEQTRSRREQKKLLKKAQRKIRKEVEFLTKDEDKMAIP